MKRIRALLLVALMASSMVVVAATQALACSCIPPRPDEEAVKDADAVFSGTMVQTEKGVNVGFDRVTWTFAVDTVYKGDVEDSQEVTSHTQSAACGLIFKEEKRYAVFAYSGAEGQASDELETNSCMNTRSLGTNEDLRLPPKAIDATTLPLPPVVEDEEAPSPNLVPIFVAAGAIFVLTGLVFVALRRKRLKS